MYIKNLNSNIEGKHASNPQHSYFYTKCISRCKGSRMFFENSPSPLNTLFTRTTFPIKARILSLVIIYLLYIDRVARTTSQKTHFGQYL